MICFREGRRPGWQEDSEQGEEWQKVGAEIGRSHSSRGDLLTRVRSWIRDFREGFMEEVELE